MVPSYVLYARLRVLCLVHLLYHMHRRLELLAVKPFRGCYHQYVFVHQNGDEQERLWCCAVSRD